MKNTTYTEKCHEFDTVILTFTKGYFILYNEKKKKKENRALLKKGCFIESQNQLR